MHLPKVGAASGTVWPNSADTADASSCSPATDLGGCIQPRQPLLVDPLCRRDFEDAPNKLQPMINGADSSPLTLHARDPGLHGPHMDDVERVRPMKRPGNRTAHEPPEPAQHHAVTAAISRLDTWVEFGRTSSRLSSLFQCRALRFRVGRLGGS